MNVDKAQKLLENVAPAFVVSAVAPLSGGAVHRVYEIRNDAGSALVLKVYREGFTWVHEKERYVHDLVRSQVELPMAELLEKAGTNLDYMRMRFDGQLKRFEELSGDTDLRRRIERHVEEREHLFVDTEHPVFCHNDAHDANLLVVRIDGGLQITGLVDWENAVSADPLFDLANYGSGSRRRARPNHRTRSAQNSRVGCPVSQPARISIQVIPWTPSQ